MGGKTIAALAAGALALGGVGVAAVATEDTSTSNPSPTIQAQTPHVEPASTGQYSATVHWGGVTEPGQTGYLVYQDGTQVADVTTPSHTFTGLDCGTTYTFGVAGHDASGHTTPTSTTTHSTPACPSGGGGGTTPVGCDRNATTSNYAAQITAATPGQVVCLASGDYSSFAGTSKAPPGITITSAPGAAVTFNTGISLLNLASIQNFTLDGTAGGGTMTVSGVLDMETSGDALVVSKALNLTFQNLVFAPQANSILIQGPENANITFNRDTFTAVNAACSGGSPVGLNAAAYLLYSTATPTTPSGVTFTNSVFVASPDLWNPSRAIQTGAPMTATNNVFVGFLDHTEAASCVHIDTLQLFSGLNGTSGGVTFTGNLCYDDYGCIMAFDGTQANTITDNACFNIQSACVNLYADTGSTTDHNVQQTGGADTSGCNTLNEPANPIQACSSSTLLVADTKTGDRPTTGETYTNNAGQPNAAAGALATNTNNLWPGASSPNINGTPTFTAGVNPTTWAGFALTSTSTGHGGATDGSDIGIRPNGGPPTGSGSAPTNTTPPAVTGTATTGHTLTTTNGTWTITGNVPTITTYQWFDCPTSTFSLSGCTPIQPQTAPGTANQSSYTLQSSDAGNYVFSYVTVTNANGQVNAHSNATGPVT